MILKVPPESLWPTGETPPALAAAIHQQGGLTPEEIRRAQPVNGQEDYRPPPRPAVDVQALEAEKTQLQLVPHMPVPQIPQRMAPAGQRYHLPLSREVTVEIAIHGSPTRADLKLLQRYVRLMTSTDFTVVAPPEPAPPPALVVNHKRPRKHATGT